MSQIFDRMVRASMLNIQLYEEVEADSTASGQAMIVVLLSSLAAGIGSFQTVGAAGLVSGTIFALLGWVIWAYLTYLIGTKIMPEPQTSSNMGELLRTIGFSSAPGVIRVLGFIPGLFWLTSTVGSLWMLAAMVVAVRQALDYQSTWRAIGVCVIGWLVQMAIGFLILSLLGVSFTQPD